MNPDRSARHSCCAPRRSRRGKASSSPTWLKRTRPRCRLGLTRTEAPSAAGEVARLATSPQGQLRLSRRRRRRGLGNTKLSPVQFHRFLPSQILSPGRRCEFLMATRRSPKSLAPAMARQDGMPRRELICLHSASADGCSVWRLPTTTVCLIFECWSWSPPINCRSPLCQRFDSWSNT